MSASLKQKAPSPIGRPQARPTAVPRPQAPTIVSWPPPPSPGSKVPARAAKRIEAAAPVREKLSTLDLAEDDILDEAVAEPSPPLRSTIPPPRSTMPPPPRLSSVPPVSTITVKKDVPSVTASVAPRASVAPGVAPSASVAPSARPSAAPTAPPPPASRARDPIDVLDETIGELEYFGTAAQAATICATALAKTLGARAVVIHQHDDKARQLRSIAVDGPKSRPLLGSATRVDDDLLASIVVATGKPTALSFDGTLPRIAPQRLRTAGAARSVVATPAMWAGSCVAVIEVIDATEAPGSKLLAEACNLVATNLAVFLGTKK